MSEHAPNRGRRYLDRDALGQFCTRGQEIHLDLPYTGRAGDISVRYSASPGWAEPRMRLGGQRNASYGPTVVANGHEQSMSLLNSPIRCQWSERSGSMEILTESELRV